MCRTIPSTGTGDADHRLVQSTGFADGRLNSNQKCPSRRGMMHNADVSAIPAFTPHTQIRAARFRRCRAASMWRIGHSG
jgi:hypothetical protein